jgi:hypothetical protein
VDNVIKKLAILLAVFFLATPSANAATALNVPFLTWEAGKQQAIVLGGPGSNGAWKMQLEGENSDPLVFNQTRRDGKGAFLYTLDLPKDLTPGAYVVQAVEENGTKTIVAGIQVKVRETYRISQIPSDLKLLVVIFAGLTAILSVIRGRKYANLSFLRRSAPAKENFFYRFRNTRLASEGDSLARYLSLQSGEPLHRLSPMLWSLLPWLVIPLGVFTAIKIQFDAAIPNGPIVLFFICAALGALDAATGISLALSLSFMHIALGNATSLRSLAVVGAFTLAWYLPALVASLIRLTINQDFKCLSPQISKVVSALLAAISGGATVALSTILTDSLVINRQASELLRWPLAVTLALVIFIKYLFESIKEPIEGREEKLFLARVVSPGFAFIIFFASLLLVYVWTNNALATLIASAVMAAPYFLLFVVFPKLGRLKLPTGKRNVLIEVAIVVGLTLLAYWAIQTLPQAVIIRSRIFILIGFVPSLLHAIYSVAIASAEYAARSKEEEVAS